MDNAPHHLVQLEKPPNQFNRKSESVKWLSENGVTADSKMLHTELISLVRNHKPPTPIYALDEMAKEKGHQVLRLPPYHFQYNAIELIWAQIKGYSGIQDEVLDTFSQLCNRIADYSAIKLAPGSPARIAMCIERPIKTFDSKKTVLASVLDI